MNWETVILHSDTLSKWHTEVEFFDGVILDRFIGQP
jgi:hypothetical protein